MQEPHLPTKTFIRHISANTKFIYTVPHQTTFDHGTNAPSRRQLRNLRLSYEDIQDLLNPNPKTKQTGKREYETNWARFMQNYLHQNSNNNDVKQTS